MVRKKYRKNYEKIKEARKQTTVPPSSDSTDSVVDSVTSITSIPQPMKVCRLCQTQDGPFLNIFGPEKLTAQKMEDLMPFVIAENDDLPHKICFRCSAKVEELHEFIQKCIKTQENLNIALGKKGPLITKTKPKVSTKYSLYKSNDDICDAVIKKAMKGIKDIPLTELPDQTKPASDAKLETSSVKQTVECFKKTSIDNNKKTSIENTKKSTIENTKNSTKENTKTKIVETSKKNVVDEIVEPEVGLDKQVVDPSLLLQQPQLALQKCDQKILQPPRSSRSQKLEPLLDGLKNPIKSKKRNASKLPISPFESSANDSQETSVPNKKHKSNNDVICLNEPQAGKSVESETKIESKSFNVMDYVSKIKVNGVGVLFQCQLCNRNFLNKKVVISHGCAKNGVPTDNTPKKMILPEPPKPPTVKYIVTKVNGESKKPAVPENKSSVEADNKITGEVTTLAVPQIRNKPKIGPASKVRRDANYSHPEVGMVVSPREQSPPSEKQNSSLSSVQMATKPSFNCRYKLVPGPNNTFTLVEDQLAALNQGTTAKVSQVKESPSDIKTKKKSKSDKEILNEEPIAKKQRECSGNNSNSLENVASSNVIDLDSEDKTGHLHETFVAPPYPVGLFQTVSHHSSIFPVQKTPEPIIFSSTTAKKQSYTVVQTDNPSKLLISAKPQPKPQIIEEVKKKKKLKRTKPVQNDTETEQPFCVTLEDTSRPKDTGFFNFINVDPLLQPSYVLPTDNIIQEISASESEQQSKENEKGRYTCNMCSEKFNREKKLIAHIQSHYSKMDEEDQVRAEKEVSKRKPRSWSTKTSKK